MEIEMFGPEAWRPLANALRAFDAGDGEAVLEIHSDSGDSVSMPVSIFFRTAAELRGSDRAALAAARGRTLDVGAGVGSVSLALQDEGRAVTALEVIPEAVEIMARRGVLDSRRGRVEDLPRHHSFDTVLLLMNGSAMAGTLAGLPRLLRTLAGLLAPGGRVLMDSTDLLGGERRSLDSGAWFGEEYPGNLQYQLEFRGERGAPFPQLFVDPGTLGAVARREGWKPEMIWEGRDREFLVRLTPETGA